MKPFPVLLLLSGVLLCRAAPVLEPVTCDEDGSPVAAHMAMHHIDETHNHGYKFRLNDITSTKVEQIEGGCNWELQLGLLETKCSVVNPKQFEDCEIREEHQRAVMSNCTVMMTVNNGEAKVTKYDCDTRQAKTNAEMVLICPDCPTLLPLNNTEGLKSVDEAVKTFNQNTTNQHYYILQEVGRLQASYMMHMGMGYFAEFVLLETRCPTGSRIVPEACKPLCPDRAHHAFCRSSYYTTANKVSVECEWYSPPNTTALGPGEQEPVCRPPHGGGRGHRPHAHDHGHGPPPHAGHGGPPPHARGQGPPPHAGHGGPPPHARGQGPPPHAGSGGHSHDHGKGHESEKGRGPPFNPHFPHGPFHACRGFLANPDPALHPICPWPHPDPRPQPRES